MNDPAKHAQVAVQHRIPKDVKEWLAQQAREQDRSANWVVCKVLTEAMAAAKSKGAAQ